MSLSVNALNLKKPVAPGAGDKDSSAASSESQAAKVGKVTIDIEIATTPQEHDVGLMFRDQMGKNHGMLFVFQKKQLLHFWMKNTKLPLSIGYFDEHKILIEVLEMEPGFGKEEKALPIYSSTKEAKYALEMNKDWFSKNKVLPPAKLLWPLVKGHK